MNFSKSFESFDFSNSVTLAHVHNGSYWAGDYCIQLYWLQLGSWNIIIRGAWGGSLLDQYTSTKIILGSFVQWMPLPPRSEPYSQKLPILLASEDSNWVFEEDKFLLIYPRVKRWMWVYLLQLRFLHRFNWAIEEDFSIYAGSLQGDFFRPTAVDSQIREASIVNIPDWEFSRLLQFISSIAIVQRSRYQEFVDKLLLILPPP